jgi:hypothetical protein
LRPGDAQEERIVRASELVVRRRELFATSCDSGRSLLRRALLGEELVRRQHAGQEIGRERIREMLPYFGSHVRSIVGGGLAQRIEIAPVPRGAVPGPRPIGPDPQYVRDVLHGGDVLVAAAALHPPDGFQFLERGMTKGLVIGQQHTAA